MLIKETKIYKVMRAVNVFCKSFVRRKEALNLNQHICIPCVAKAA